VTALGTALKEEGALAGGAVRNGSLRSYVDSVTLRLSKARVNASERGKELLRFVNRDPKRAATDFVTLVVAFYVGSGGLDGDGGVPDVDLELGIGAHRSIFTHSVISGIAIEAVALAFIDLASVIYSKLPEDKDPLWDEVYAHGSRLARRFSEGVSLGIAYHLGVDATVDGGGSYKDLPVTVPALGHQQIAAVNAALEAMDGAARPGAVLASFREYKAASAMVKAAKSTSFVIRRTRDGTSFDVIYSPRRGLSTERPA